MSDPREELARLVDVASVPPAIDSGAWHQPYAVADAVLAAGYVKLSDLASDPAVIEKVAKVLAEFEARDLGVPNVLPLPEAAEVVRDVFNAAAAALAATPGDSNE